MCYAYLAIVLAITHDQVKPVALVSVEFGKAETVSSTALLREPMLPCSCKNHQLFSTSKVNGGMGDSPPDSNRAST